jgi:poly(3-hydroxybutyrate) depolymerase
VGELAREYRLRLPAGYDPGTAVPLVLAIHGYTDTAERFESEIPAIGRHADTHGYVVVFPQATGFEVDGTPAEDGFLYTPTSQVMSAWAGLESQQCSSEESAYPTSRDGTQGFRCVQRANCATGAEVVDCACDGGHGLLRRNEDQFVVEVIWDFFEKNGR